jgi:hypothetical protein
MVEGSGAVGLPTAGLLICMLACVS